LFCTVLCNCLIVRGMTDLPSAKEITLYVSQTFDKFGDYAYLAEEVKKYGGPAVDQLEKVRKIMADTQYVFAFVDMSRDLWKFFRLYLYKKNESGYTFVGYAEYCKDAYQDDVFNLRILHVDRSERNHGAGTALFLYGLHIVRQLTYSELHCSLRWTVRALDPHVGPSTAALCAFYEQMGGILESSGGERRCEIVTDFDATDLYEFVWHGPVVLSYDQYYKRFLEKTGE